MSLNEGNTLSRRSEGLITLERLATWREMNLSGNLSSIDSTRLRFKFFLIQQTEDSMSISNNYEITAATPVCRNNSLSVSLYVSLPVSVSHSFPLSIKPKIILRYQTEQINNYYEIKSVKKMYTRL